MGSYITKEDINEIMPTLISFNKDDDINTKLLKLESRVILLEEKINNFKNPNNEHILQQIQ